MATLLVAWLAVAGVGDRRVAPLTRSVPAFDLARARADQKLLARAPRPGGSEAHDVARDEIARALRATGFAVQVEVGPACSAIGFWEWCARTENIVGVLEGRPGTEAVLLAAHYDSVPNGYGASDDIAGVASIVEVARSLAAEKPPRNTIIALLTDEEEDGSLGAVAFVHRNPRARAVRAFINLEARGSHGASAMYRVTPASAPLVRAFARSAVRPASDSLLATLAGLLPNSDDAVVFAGAGMKGFAFAYIDGLENYHSYRDDFDAASPASLEHQGAQTLSLARALAEADLSGKDAAAWSEPNPMYFDVLGRFVVTCPRWAARVLGISAAAFVAFVALRAGRASGQPSVGRAMGATLGILVVATAVTEGAAALVRWRVAMPTGAAYAKFFVVGIALALLAAVALLSARGRFVSVRTWRLGLIGVLGVLSGVTAVVAPETTFVAAFPAVALGTQDLLVGPSALVRPSGAVARAASWGAGWVAIYVFVRLAAIATIMSGAASPGAPVALALIPTVPAVCAGWARRTRWLPLFAGGAGLGLAGVPLVATPYSAADSLVYLRDADRASATWLSGDRRPSPWVAAMLGERRVFGAVPAWSPDAHAVWSAPAPVVALPAPRIEVIDRSLVDGMAHSTLLVWPARAHSRLELREMAGAPVVLRRFDGVAPTSIARFSPELDRRLIRWFAPQLAADFWHVILAKVGSDGTRLEIEAPPSARLSILECTDGWPFIDEAPPPRPPGTGPGLGSDRTCVASSVPFG